MSTRTSRSSGNGKGTPSTKTRATTPAKAPAALLVAPTPAAPSAPAKPAGPAGQRVRMTEKSLAKAKAAFANFSLSKFPKGQTPATHVASGQTAAQVHRDAVSTHLADAPLNGTMSFALTATALKSLLPSYDATKGTVSLDDVINALHGNMRGKEFYANGNPTLNRLAVQSQAQDIIASIIAGTKK